MKKCSESYGYSSSKPRPQSRKEQLILAWQGRPGRVIAIDIARALAILGMVCAHELPTVDQSLNANWGMVLLGLSHGRSSALFAFLAGMSLAIISGQDKILKPLPMVQTRLRICVRAILLLIINAVLSYINVGIALILSFYAMWFMLSLPLLSWSASKLLKTAGLLALAGPICITSCRGLSEYFGLFSEDFFIQTVFFGIYPGLCYMSYICVGMALVRLGAARPAQQRRPLVLRTLMVGFLLLTFGLGGSTLIDSIQKSQLSLVAFGVEDQKDYSSKKISPKDLPNPCDSKTMQPSDPENAYSKGDSKDMQDMKPQDPIYGEIHKAKSLSSFFRSAAIPAFINPAPHSNSTLETLGNLGFCLIIVSLLLLFPPVLTLLLSPLAALGSMALSAYFLHVSIHGISKHIQNWTLYDFSWISMLVWQVVLLILLASLWRFTQRRGPLEQLLHSVSWRACQLTISNSPSTNTQNKQPDLRGLTDKSTNKPDPKG